MRPLTDSDMVGARLRRGGGFVLHPNDELDPTVRETLGPLVNEPDFFGVLAPAGSSALPARAISRDAALLLYQLASPACVPRLLESLFGRKAPQRVRELVADGILEIEHEGVFTSGMSFITPSSSRAAPETHIGQLSRGAVEHALELRGLSVREIARHLYLYNRVPGRPDDHRRLASPHHVLSYCSLSPVVAEHLASDWAIDTTSDGWIQARRPGPAGSARFKLYVSPVLEDMPQVFGISLDALRRTTCTAFKIGADSVGLLRPDKFVAYFHTIDDLQRVASTIETACAGVSVQGVPFSGVIDSSGLLSWGMDPPAQHWTGPGGAQSWRQWVVERLAVHIAAARESARAAPSTAALGRLALDGVDVDRWTPSLAIWAEDETGAF